MEISRHRFENICSIIFEILSIILCIVTMLIEKKYQILQISLIAIVLIAILFPRLPGNRKITDFIYVNKYKNAPKQLTPKGYMLVPGFALIATGIKDIEIISWYYVIFPSVVLFSIMMSYIVYTRKWEPHPDLTKFNAYSGIALCLIFISIGMTLNINELLDYKSAYGAKAHISGKVSEKCNRCYINYSIETEAFSKNEYKIPCRKFKNLKNGDSVEVTINYGLFNIKWIKEIKYYIK